MVLRQRQRFCMAIAKKRKQTDRGGREKEKRQNDEQEDTGAKASPKDLPHLAPLSLRRSELLTGTCRYGMQLCCHRKLRIILALIMKMLRALAIEKRSVRNQHSM